MRPSDDPPKVTPFFRGRRVVKVATINHSSQDQRNGENNQKNNNIYTGFVPIQPPIPKTPHQPIHYEIQNINDLNNVIINNTNITKNVQKTSGAIRNRHYKPAQLVPPTIANLLHTDGTNETQSSFRKQPQQINSNNNSINNNSNLLGFTGLPFTKVDNVTNMLNDLAYQMSNNSISNTNNNSNITAHFAASPQDKSSSIISNNLSLIQSLNKSSKFSTINIITKPTKDNNTSNVSGPNSKEQPSNLIEIPSVSMIKSNVNSVVNTEYNNSVNKSSSIKPGSRGSTHQSSRDSSRSLSGSSINIHNGVYVLSKYRNELTPFEQNEITGYSKVYYWGQHIRKSYPSNGFNNGYDDQRGDYLGVLHDHIFYRYELMSLLGSGSFGKVFKAYDHMASTMVSLKIIRNKKRFHKQGEVEVKLLQHLRDHDPNDNCNCLRIINSFYFRSHLCIVSELLSINLYELLCRGDLKGMTVSLVRKFALQLLNALRYSAKHKIIHADLKPENILLKDPTKSGIKVIDWGSGCFENEKIYTYIQSRFYRAPEVILGLNYGLPIDIWSVGCVLAELYTGTPIFPGDDERDQLGKITEVLGMPPRDMIIKSPRKGDFFLNYNERSGSQLQLRLKTNHKPGVTSISNAVKGPNDFISFLAALLVWDPTKRLTPDQALQHPWMQEGIRMLRMKRENIMKQEHQHQYNNTTEKSEQKQGSNENEANILPKL